MQENLPSAGVLQSTQTVEDIQRLIAEARKEPKKTMKTSLDDLEDEIIDDMDISLA